MVKENKLSVKVYNEEKLENMQRSSVVTRCRILQTQNNKKLIHSIYRNRAL